MKRTNIVLEEWQYQYLKERAELEGKSMSAIIRQLLETTSIPKQITDDPIFEIIGMFRGGRKNVAERHDDYLYTVNKRRS